MISLPNLSSVSTAARSVRLFRNGANQAIRIPREFELAGAQASIRQVGNTLVIEPMSPQHPQGSLAALMSALGQIESSRDFVMPDLDAGLLPLDDITLSAA